MENRDYREEIGKKLEEALELGDFSELEDLIEMPSPETFAKWTELGVEKHNKRVRRKRTLAACAIFVVVCVSALIAIKCIAPPEVEAGPDDRLGIDITDMESTTTYDSWNDLPSDIKDQFIEIKDLPDGYEVEKVVVAESEGITKIEIRTINTNKNRVIIRQIVSRGEFLDSSFVPNENFQTEIEGIKVYIEKSENVETTTYKYLVGDIIIDIIFGTEANQEMLKTIIKTTHKYYN